MRASYLASSVVPASTDRRLTLPGVWGIPGLPWQCSLDQEIAEFAKALQGFAYNRARLTVPGVQFTGRNLECLGWVPAGIRFA